jgi:geranylgeranyl diphosphate synthase type II
MAKGEILKELNSWIRKRRFDSNEKIKAVTEVYNKLNIKDLTKSRVEILFKEARLSLEEVSASNERKGVLREFAFQLMTREK